MSDIHQRVSRRIESFLSNNKSADRVAAEILQIVASAGRHAERQDAGERLGPKDEHAVTAKPADAQPQSPNPKQEGE